MSFSPPEEMVGRRVEWARLSEFATSGEPHASLGIVWGRRRVGKSFLLESLVERSGGFYYGAVRGSKAEALRDLGAQIGAFQRSPAPLALEDWDTALRALLALGDERERLVILDEYPYLIEHSPELDSVIQRVLSPRGAARTSSRARLVLCGSAMSVMRHILGGSAPLRGRAGLDLRISPFDFRTARELHDIDDLATAVRTYAVLGGVAAYAREMSSSDLPDDPEDFDRWICRRVLSPAAPLFGEIPLLLSEDPATAKARKPNLYHATLAGIARGHTTHSALTSYVKIPGASLAPIVEALVAAHLVERIQDPVRGNRPTYHPGDPLIRFHYAVIRRHQVRLARHNADTRKIWDHLRPAFDSQVLGPAFESMARYWIVHFAPPGAIGGVPDHVGPTVLSLPDGGEQQIDMVVAADDAEAPSGRTVLALGEAKAGERLGMRHVRRLEGARDALGARASHATLLLFGSRFTRGVVDAAGERPDLELIGLDRLYGSPM